jgi:hypothetical protein
MMPFQHELNYNQLIAEAGATSFLTEVPVEAYGHCDFTKAEILDAFGRMTQAVTGIQRIGGWTSAVNELGSLALRLSENRSRTFLASQILIALTFLRKLPWEAADRRRREDGIHEHW